MIAPSPKGFFELLTDRRFAPLFICQFWSAFADNTFRSALVVMATYDQALLDGLDSRVMVSFIGLIFILPFFLFSAIAGQLADKFEKTLLVKIMKALEIGIILIAAYGFYHRSLSVLIFTLFLSATQATFFGPIKYSLLPNYLKDNELVAGNGLVEASTFLAILLGSMTGGSLVAFYGHNPIMIDSVILLTVVLGFISSLYLIPARIAAPNLKLNINILQETVHILRQGMRNRIIFLTIIGISWFWLVGGVFLAQITTYGREVINGNENVATLFLVLFSLGISCGSAICYRLMKGEINARLVPWGAFGITVFMVDLVFASPGARIASPEYIGILQFLSHGDSWRIIFDLFMTAFCGGLYTVPLYALLQKTAGPSECSRMIAANNIANAFFMVLSSVLSLVMLALGLSILTIFLTVGLVNLWVMMRISRLVPESIRQLFLQVLLKLLFRVEVKGLENLQFTGKRVLIIANHTSFLDATLLFAFIPEKLSFAIFNYYMEKWWIRVVTTGVQLFPINPTNPMAVRGLIEYLRQDRKCVIFPEGRLSSTGSLMKIFDGPGMIADKAQSVILPIRIDGVQYSLFTRLKGKVRQQLFPKIRITILPPYCLAVPQNLIGRERRRVLSSQVYNTMTEMLFETSPYQTTLFSALIEAAKSYGMRFEIVEDIDRSANTYRKLLARSFILGRYLLPMTKDRERVGLLLPTSVGGIVSFFALQSIGRVPAMLNFTLGVKTVMHCAQLARLRIILTSRRFVTNARLEEMMLVLAQHYRIIYLEDVVKRLSLLAKLRGLACAHFPRLSYQHRASDEDTALILFTSGSEGAPKAVALSHRNINANRYQITSYVDVSSQDVVLNVLPMFHSFGLTVGTLLPILTGVPTFLYPSPLHYRLIPALIYDINATIFFATDTFLSRYARTAHPYDFYAIRYVFAGAEKLRHETRQAWSSQFGINILEAYGTTEASPGVAANTRMYNKTGTVGRFFPAVHYQLEKIEGIDKGGRLHIKGPNVMQGYLDFATGEVAPTISRFGKGWYDTGDIVSVDDEGFVTILGRAKRFAKIGGEMISLIAVEEVLYSLYPTAHHVAFAQPDERKGEKLVLLTTAAIQREDLSAAMKSLGLGEIMCPREIQSVSAIPLLASGKVDLQNAQLLLNNT